MLPPEVVGQHVLAFLNLKSLVKLDTTIMDPKQRVEFLALLNYCPPVAIHQDIQASKEELLWFKQRKCRIKEMKLSLLQSDYYDVDTSMADRVALHIKRTIVSSDLDFFSQSDVSSTISSIDMWGEQDIDLIYSLFSLVPNVKELTVKPFASYIKPTPNVKHMLQTLNLSVMKLTDDIAQFIYQLGKHLKRLDLMCADKWEVNPNDFLEELGLVCPNLEVLKITRMVVPDKDVLWHSGIIALIKSCYLLHTLRIPHFDVSALAINAIAENCPTLKRLSLRLTDIRNLITLSNHRIPQEELSIPWIPIPSAEVAAQCAHALSRIQRLWLTPELCVDVPSLYIGYLISLRELSLSEHLTAENSLKVLRAVAEHCRQVETVDICARTDGIVEQLVALVSSNRRLNSITFHEATALTDEVLIDLARYCPNLANIHIRDSLLITDTGLIAVFTNSLNIFSVYLANCPQLSDASILALSECKQLKSFMIQQSNHVTETALIHIIQSCCHLSYMVLTHNYMSEATRARLLSQRSKKPTKYAKLDLILSDPFI